MATLSSLVSAIDKIIKDDSYDLVSCINEAVNTIAGGIRMPDGEKSPALPGLLDYDTVTTTALAYVSLPEDFQRNVFMVLDSSGNVISPPSGGSYQSFSLFLNQSFDKRLTETGSVYRVCSKGTRLYYQGIPSVAEILGIHFYRKPATLALDEDVPEGIPDHLAGDLIKHFVIKEIMGEQLEAGVSEPSRGFEYHTKRFYERMNDLCDYCPVDTSPQYYGVDDNDWFGSM